MSTAADLSPQNAFEAIKASASCQQCDVLADGPCLNNLSVAMLQHQSFACRNSKGYFFPRLCYQHRSGRVEEVTNDGLSVQYSTASSAEAFPAGLTMIAGNPAAQTSEPEAKTGLTCHENPIFPLPFCPDDLIGRTASYSSYASEKTK